MLNTLITGLALAFVFAICFYVLTANRLKKSKRFDLIIFSGVVTLFVARLLQVFVFSEIADIPWGANPLIEVDGQIIIFGSYPWFIFRFWDIRIDQILLPFVGYLGILVSLWLVRDRYKKTLTFSANRLYISGLIIFVAFSLLQVVLNGFVQPVTYLIVGVGTITILAFGITKLYDKNEVTTNLVITMVSMISLVAGASYLNLVSTQILVFGGIIIALSLLIFVVDNYRLYYRKKEQQKLKRDRKDRITRNLVGRSF